ncbi:hypothetical protein OIU78_016791 [Salix suchowensis]|nr:hypothetical protein OIU78_016791 [Salix suchowensis]
MLVIDISVNSLTGSIPQSFGNLTELQELQLSLNQISGEIPAQLGNCQKITHIELDNNQITGSIPPEIAQIGNLKNLNFLDLGSNRITGVIPEEISGCQNLAFLDLHSNAISGNLPRSFNKLVSLQFVDFSNNLIEGTLSPSLGSLGSLTKLTLAKNRLSGTIPSQLGSCSKLQLLDLSGNQLSGNIPSSVGKIPSLEIALNLSLNQLNGEIPSEFTGLSKLGILDISYNHLTGDLQHLAALQNLVVLNVSHNNFSGHVPDTPFFSKLPLSVLSGNPALCFSGNQCDSDDKHVKRGAAARVAMIVLLCAACALLLAALFMILLSKTRGSGAQECDGEDDLEMSPPWEVTLYQKLDLSIADVARSLTAGNVIGQGRSGVVYKVTIPSELMVAVKRFNSAEKISAAAFSSEIATLARIRHRNIVRLLGWGANRKTKLLFYDYMANGTLGTLLHEGNTAGLVEWETRFKIALGWVRDHLRCKKDPVEILDPKLQGHADTQIQEMLQALGISLLCTSNRAEDRPTMKDVAALLKEIRQELIPGGEAQKPTSKTSKTMESSQSFSSSSVTPAQLLMLQQGSSRCSLAYSSSSSASIMSSTNQ